MTQVVSNKVKRGSFRGMFSQTFSAVVTGNVATSLADGVGISLSLTVPGVALGDMVVGRALSVDNQGITVTAVVSAANTVIVRLQNESTGTLDLGTITISLFIVRPDTNFFATT